MNSVTDSHVTVYGLLLQCTVLIVKLQHRENRFLQEDKLVSCYQISFTSGCGALLGSVGLLLLSLLDWSLQIDNMNRLKSVPVTVSVCLKCFQI